MYDFVTAPFLISLYMRENLIFLFYQCRFTEDVKRGSSSRVVFVCLAQFLYRYQVPKYQSS
jgi:hypothetical protein